MRVANFSLLCLLLYLLPACALSQDIHDGIVWMPQVQISPDTLFHAGGPIVVTHKDAVYLTWGASPLSFPFLKSTDNGHAFDPLRLIVNDNVGIVQLPWLVASGDKLFGFYLSAPPEGYFASHYVSSTDGGNTWSPSNSPPLIVHEWPNAFGADGDTLALMTDGYNIELSTDAGNHWKGPVGNWYFATSDPSVALTNGILHRCAQTGYDSAGYWAEFVITYWQSTDFGVTWGDSVPISTVNYSYALEPYMSADNQGDSSVVAIAWKDEKYGCETPVGCSVIARWSTDNGRTFHPEIRMDDEPNGYAVWTAVKGNVIVIGWIADEYPNGAVKVRVSTDRGTTWSSVYRVSDYGANCSLGISRTAVHVTWEKVDADGGFSAWYRRGVFQSMYDPLTVVGYAGWNLISIPVNPKYRTIAFLFPQSTSSAFLYHGGYKVADSLQGGTAYWVKLSQPWEMGFEGDSLFNDTIEVQEGWNMIGSISVPVAISAIASIPPAITTSKFFGYDHTYYMSDTLFPSRGYWVKADQPAKLILKRGSSFLAKNTIRVSETMADGPPPPPDAMPSVQTTMPKEYALDSPFPNPFNPTTVIRYQLPVASRVNIQVFNMLGQVVATLLDGIQTAGYKEVRWNSAGATSGVYFCRLSAGNFVQTRKMVLLK